MRNVLWMAVAFSGVGLAVACSSNSNGALEADATLKDGVDCGYPEANNDATCPSMYSTQYGGRLCSPVGLECSYPGAGDGDPETCNAATAILVCEGLDSGIGGGEFQDASGFDAGDASVGYWIFAQ